MTMGTAHIAGGDRYTRDELLQGWYAYINAGEYTDAQQAAIADWITDVQVDAIQEALPTGVHYDATAGEITGPAEYDLEEGTKSAELLGGMSPDEWVRDLFEQAAQAAAERYDEIEHDALLRAAPTSLAELGDAITEAAELEPVDQITRLEILRTAANELLSRARARAAYDATRTAPWSSVADEAGLSEAAINRLVTAHRATIR